MAGLGLTSSLAPAAMGAPGHFCCATAMVARFVCCELDLYCARVAVAVGLLSVRSHFAWPRQPSFTAA